MKHVNCLVGLVAVLLLLGSGPGLITICQAEEVEAPKTIEEARDRLEKVLGRFDPDHNRQVRFDVDTSYKHRPDPDQPEVLVVSRGAQSYGNPYLLGESLAFDQVEQIERSVYDLTSGGERSLKREQQRYDSFRTTLRLGTTGRWSYDQVILSHAIPSQIDKPYETGTARWLSDGVELIGIATDEYYGPDGALVPAAWLIRTRITREGDEVVVRKQADIYHLAQSPDGVPLPFPDFSRRIGEPREGSESRTRFVEATTE